MFQKVYKTIYISIPLICLFFIGLFFDKEKTISEIENRSLYTYKGEDEFDLNKFEKYLSDRILFREELINIYFWLGIHFETKNFKYLKGKENWIFSRKNPLKFNLPVLKNYQNSLKIPPNMLNKIKLNLTIIQKFCEENNILLYIAFPPDKSRVYSRYMPSYIFRKKAPSPVEQVMQDTELSEKFKFIELEKPLIEASYGDELVYFRQETHWNETGAFLAYQKIMQAIQKDLKDVKPLSREDFIIEKKECCFAPYYSDKEPSFHKQNQWIPGMKKLDEKYEHFVFKSQKNIQVVYNGQFRHSNNPNGFPYNVYIIGDSFATYLHNFFAASFQKVRAYRINESNKAWGIYFNDRKKEMLEQKTDILILSISDLKLKDFLRIY